MNTTDALVEFLRARLDEDETLAREADGEAWTLEREHHDGEESYWDVDGPNGGWIAHVGERPDAEHIARHDPARALREAAAERRIIEWVEDQHVPGSTVGDFYRYALYALAQTYDGHPDFREEWRLEPALRWHYDADRMRCTDCNAEVYAFNEGYICSGCNRQADE